MAEQMPAPDWMTEPEAADYARCSLWSFRKMRLAACNSGGRKVYHRGSIDAALMARPWQPSTSAEAPTTSTVTEQYAHHQPSYGRAAVATMGAWGRRESPGKAQAIPQTKWPRSSAG